MHNWEAKLDKIVPSVKRWGPLWVTPFIIICTILSTSWLLWCQQSLPPLAPNTMICLAFKAMEPINHRLRYPKLWAKAQTEIPQTVSQSKPLFLFSCLSPWQRRSYHRVADSNIVCTPAHMLCPISLTSPTGFLCGSPELSALPSLPVRQPLASQREISCLDLKHRR